jgi:hypothetical protein
VGKLGLPRNSSEINKTLNDNSYKAGVTEYEAENTEVIREYENLAQELVEDEDDVNRKLQLAAFQERDFSDFLKGDQVRYFLFNAATQK